MFNFDQWMHLFYLHSTSLFISFKQRRCLESLDDCIDCYRKLPHDLKDAASAPNPALIGLRASNRTNTPPTKASGPPTRPRRAIRRGTSPDLYIKYPSSIPLPNPAQNCGPSRNVQLWNARSPLAAT